MFRESRRLVLKDRIDDEEYFLQNWRWGMSPSEIRKTEKKIDKLKKKYKEKFGDLDGEDE